MSGTRPVSPGLLTRTVPAIVAALLAGCTMCPDPFDYSGPVPNGSTPHNDFRARSNGIEPIGVAPRPWPPVVKRQDEAAATQTVLASGSQQSGIEVPKVIAEEPLDIAAAFEGTAR